MLVFLVLGFLTCYGSGTTEVAVDDVELVNLLNNASSAVFRASQWLLSERQEASGWGSFTPRAVVALALAAPYYPLPQGQWNLITKQLQVHLSMQLANGGPAEDKSSHLSRLALSVNALLSICQDPRRFQGLDLVQMLRSETDAAVHKSGDSFSLPSVFLSLCLAGETTHADLKRLAMMYQASRNKTDLQAIQLLGMSCITNQTNLSSFRPSFVSYLRDFASRFQNSLQRGAMDVYTKALAMQALFSGDLVMETSSLLSNQEPDGSFERSLLATYHAIPALMGTSLLAIKDKQCQKQQAGRLESPAQSSSKVVQLSVWIGEGLERDIHSLTVAIGDNDTLLEVLGAARKRNPIFRFKYDETPTGARVYSLAGTPNDAEREVSWKLYTQKKGKHEHLKEVHAGVDKVYPSPEDNIVFWFKRN